MLKIYNSMEEVPEALRTEYKMVGGKAVPDLSDDHPVLVNNRTLLNEKTTAETKASGLETQVTSLKADLESAKASNLPRGHRAVPVADVEILEKLKAHGTPQEVEAKLTEHKTLKEESEARKTADHLKSIAKELGYNEEAFALIPNLPEFEIRDKDGKKSVIAKVKDDKGTITEKPAAEFIESSPHIAPLLPALKVSNGGTRVPEQHRDQGGAPTNMFDKIRQDVKQREEAATKQAEIPLEKRSGITVIGGAAA